MKPSLKEIVLPLCIFIVSCMFLFGDISLLSATIVYLDTLYPSAFVLVAKIIASNYLAFLLSLQSKLFYFFMLLLGFLANPKMAIEAVLRYFVEHAVFIFKTTIVAAFKFFPAVVASCGLLFLMCIPLVAIAHIYLVKDILKVRQLALIYSLSNFVVGCVLRIFSKI